MSDATRAGDSQVPAKTIRHAIFYTIDQAAPQIAVSNALLKADDTETREYFAGQLANIEADHSKHNAGFDPDVVDGPAQLLRELAKEEDEGQFVAIARQIATRLLGISRRNHRIKKGVLLIFNYSEGDRCHLALIKLDLVDVFKPEARGEREVLAKVRDTLPSLSAHLQKAAIISDSPLAGVDGWVVDRLVGDSGASFWTRDFLGLRPALTSAEQTRRAFTTLQQTEQKLRSRLSEGDQAYLRSSIHQVFFGEQANLGSFIDGLALAAETKSFLKTSLAEKRADLQFVIDPAVVAQKMPRARFKGDYGFRLEIYRDHLAQILVEPPRILNGKTRLVLDIDNFTEV